jgi:CheY-like chemotaxis protein
MEDVATQLGKILDELGQSAVEVARTLKAHRVQGVRSTARFLNPIVRHVQAELLLSCLDMDLMQTGTFRILLLDRRTVEVALPQPVVEFLHAFNNGGYPELEFPGEPGQELLDALRASQRSAPATPGAPAPLGSTSASGDRRTEAAAHSSALRILVVDDNRDHADTLVMMLRLFGYEARPLYDPSAVMQVASEFRPHVFLLDLVMPHMNGLSLAEKLRASAEGKDSMLIGMTGFHGVFQDSHAAAAGFDHFLLKPVNRFLLENVLEGWAKRVLCECPGPS